MNHFQKAHDLLKQHSWTLVDDAASAGPELTIGLAVLTKPLHSDLFKSHSLFIHISSEPGRITPNTLMTGNKQKLLSFLTHQLSAVLSLSGLSSQGLIYRDHQAQERSPFL